MTNTVVAASNWEAWHEWNAEVMRPITEWFARATRPAPGHRILDAACGTGIPTLALAAHAGRVIASDVSAAMLSAVRNKARAAGLVNIETREASLTALGDDDAAFDAVTCKDGLMYCADMVAGARELRRVLRPGGAFAFSAWAEPAANPFFTTMFGTLLAMTKRPAPPPDAPGPLRLAAPGELERVVRAAGLSNVTVERISITWTFDSPDHHWRAVTQLAAPLEQATQQLPAPEVARLKQAIADAIAPFSGGDGVRIPGVALCASGTR